MTYDLDFPYVFHVEHRQRSAGELLKSGGNEIDLPLSDEQVDQFLIYLRDLKSWNRTINLTALKTEPVIIVRHFLESLLVLKFHSIPTLQSILDIGTGAGFPGLPLKIMRPDLRLTLLEASNKKVAFLRHIVGCLKLSEVKIEPVRLEDYAERQTVQGSFDLIVTRAVKMESLLGLASRLLKKSGALILFRKHPLDVARSILDLNGFVIQQQHPYTLPFGYQGGVLTILAPCGSAA